MCSAKRYDEMPEIGEKVYAMYICMCVINSLWTRWVQDAPKGFKKE